jgi:hypothetical protein
MEAQKLSYSTHSIKFRDDEGEEDEVQIQWYEGDMILFPIADFALFLAAFLMEWKNYKVVSIAPQYSRVSLNPIGYIIVVERR